MTLLERFSTPARLEELDDAGQEAWSAVISGVFAQFDDRPQLYDPTKRDTPEDARLEPIVWAAFPASLLPEATSQDGRWALADSSRHRQDEYCEWAVERDADDNLTRVTFTCETPEYFVHLAQHAPDLLLDFYREFVSAEVQLEDLLDGEAYVKDNQWNQSTNGRPAHLMQGNNTLGAAVDLVAQATVRRHDHGGAPVTSKQELARCAGLGNEFRNSDPQIAALINSAARSGDEVTLLDPVALYIDGIDTTGMITPDGADPTEFWRVERGTAEHTLRAAFEVPEKRGYTVGDITLQGRRLKFGAQLADRVAVRVTAVVKPANHDVPSHPCGAMP